MKNNLKKIFNVPKIGISITAIIAICIAIISYASHKRDLENNFLKISNLSSLDSTNSNPAPSKDLTLAFPIGGRISKVNVKTGDTVKTGTILASLDALNATGALNQAQAAYNQAQTAYQKLVNGASDPDIEVARVALNNAKNAYETTVAQQKVLVENAQRTMLNSGLTALPTLSGVNVTGAPTISGTYNGSEKGTYNITVYTTGGDAYFSLSGIENGNGPVKTIPVPLGTRGLYIQFPSNSPNGINTTWSVSIPNTQSPSYLTNYNLYQSALETKDLAVAQAQNVINVAQAALDQKVASARSEDLQIALAQVESTKGALQIAQGTFNNTIIKAPVDGTITNVTITAGQIISPNTAAIELLSK